MEKKDIEMTDEAVKAIKETLAKHTKGMAVAFEGMMGDLVKSVAKLTAKAKEGTALEDLPETREFKDFEKAMNSISLSAKMLIASHHAAGMVIVDMRQSAWQEQQLDKQQSAPVPSEIAELANNLMARLTTKKE